jgi:hypothetical protein
MWARIGLVSVAAVLAGCKTCPPPPPPVPPEVVVKTVKVDTACDWDEAIYIDPINDKLTPETYRQIDKHNRTGADRCGWKPKTKATKSK